MHVVTVKLALRMFRRSHRSFFTSSIEVPSGCTCCSVPEIIGRLSVFWKKDSGAIPCGWWPTACSPITGIWFWVRPTPEPSPHLCAG